MTCFIACMAGEADVDCALACADSAFGSIVGRVIGCPICAICRGRCGTFLRQAVQLCQQRKLWESRDMPHQRSRSDSVSALLLQEAALDARVWSPLAKALRSNVKVIEVSRRSLP